jgi:hypothetical protein
MPHTFTAHNIDLGNGVRTKPEIPHLLEDEPWFTSAKRMLNRLFPGDKSNLRLADLGCLEGGFAVGFARMGFQTLGIEVRAENFEKCRFVQEQLNFPNLEFAHDNAWNLWKYGQFDAIFCSGLLYHLDRPFEFMKLMHRHVRHVLFINTHFTTATSKGRHPLSDQFSELCENEGLQGRWYNEFPDDASFAAREAFPWSSWDNRNSFWVRREYLLHALQEIGFDIVLEQFDAIGPEIRQSMIDGFYFKEDRSLFVAMKSGLS